MRGGLPGAVAQRVAGRVNEQVEPAAARPLPPPSRPPVRRFSQWLYTSILPLVACAQSLTVARLTDSPILYATCNCRTSFFPHDQRRFGTWLPPKLCQALQNRQQYTLTTAGWANDCIKLQRTFNLSPACKSVACLPRHKRVVDSGQSVDGG